MTQAEQYFKLNSLLKDINENKDVSKIPAASTSKQSVEAPNIVFKIWLKLSLSIVLMVLMIVVFISIYMINQMKTVQLKSMQDKGKVIANQAAKLSFEPMGRMTKANQNEIISIDIEPVLKQNTKEQDVVYIKLYDKARNTIWSGGEKNDRIRDRDVPFYNMRLIQAGKKAPESIRRVAEFPMSGLDALTAVINKAIRLSDTYYDIAAPITLFGAQSAIGEIHIGFSQRSANIQTLKIVQAIILLAFVFIAIALGISIIFALYFTKPIARLTDAMVKISHGDLNQVVPVASADEVGLLTWNFNNMTAELREKEKMRDSFGKAVSEEIVEVMMSGDLFLGGEEKSVTMLFSDIRSFTKTSSSLTPSEVMSMLNEYFTIMEYVVNRNMGIIDKYVGDEIMAIFGATDPNQDHAENACRCAVEMILELDKLNEKRKSEGKIPLRIGIGINTGIVTAGMLGSQNRMNYTVIGDTVNMASRLCDAGGSHGFSPIVIAEDTYEMIKDVVKVRSGHSIAVKGKERPVKIYELLGITDRKTTIQIKLDEILAEKT